MTDRLPGIAPSHLELTLTDRELLERLGWFTQVRWAVGVFCLVLLTFSHYVLNVQFHVGQWPVPVVRPVLAIIGLFAYNGVFSFLVRRLRRYGPVTRRRIQQLAMGQIACDLAGVCALVYATGGIENAFIVLTVLPLVIASELLPRRLALTAAAGAVALIHALAWSEQQGLIPHVGVTWPGNTITEARLYADPLYVLEVTGALTVLLFGTVFLAATIAGQLRRREEDLEGAYRQIRSTDEAKGFFMRRAGHELRSPLVAVGSILKAIVQTVDSLSDEHRRLLSRAQARTQSMMAILDDLRRYANLRSAQDLVSSRHSVDLSRLVQEVVELLRPQAQGASLSINCRTADAVVCGDEELLREVVSNLLVNAIQYTPAGGRIDVVLKRSDDSVVLEVADTGIGIDADARSRLFDEFFRSEEARKVFADGTGLGLAICRRIVQMHGGQIEASNGAIRGSVFTVTLPAGAKRSGAETSDAAAPAVGTRLSLCEKEPSHGEDSARR
jgi:signal transduction histidine kinase